MNEMSFSMRSCSIKGRRKEEEIEMIKEKADVSEMLKKNDIRRFVK